MQRNAIDRGRVKVRAELKLERAKLRMQAIRAKREEFDARWELMELDDHGEDGE